MHQGSPQWPKDSWTPAVRCLGFRESEPLCLPKGQLSMSEMRSPRPRVERRPWARRGNGEAWACHRLRHSLEVFLPCRNLFYNAHLAALWTLPLSEGSLTRNGICLAVGQLQTLRLLYVKICVPIFFLVPDPRSGTMLRTLLWQRRYH